MSLEILVTVLPTGYSSDNSYITVQVKSSDSSSKNNSSDRSLFLLTVLITVLVIILITVLVQVMTTGNKQL